MWVPVLIARRLMATSVVAACALLASAPAARAQSVAQDIAALAAEAGAQRAAARLVERGSVALPELYAALRAPDAQTPQLARLMEVLAAIGDASSVAPIAEVAARHPEPWILKPALRALAALPQTDASLALAARIAGNASETWSVRRLAFDYFATHRDARGRQWADPLLDADDPERRAAALFLLARLGDEEALGPILDLLRHGVPPRARAALLLGMAELLDASDFEYRSPPELSWSREYQSALRYARYRSAEGAQRAEACREMLRASAPGHAALGVRCLLEIGRSEDLLPYLALDGEAPTRTARLKAEIRKAGYRLIESEGGLRIEPAAPVPAAVPGDC